MRSNRVEVRGEMPRGARWEVGRTDGRAGGFFALHIYPGPLFATPRAASTFALRCDRHAVRARS